MTVTVFPQPDHIPPRVQINVSSDDEAKPFASLIVRRDGAPLREQPFVGGAETVLFDYEAPFGVPVTYSVEGVAVAPTTIYSTSWADLSGWSTLEGSPVVTGGQLTSSSFSASVKRTVPLPTQGRLTLASPIGMSSGFTTDSLTLSPGLRVHKTGGGGPLVKRYVAFGGTTQQVTHTSGPMTVQWSIDAAIVTTSDGSWTIPGVWDGSGNEVSAEVSGGSVPGFTIEALEEPVQFAASATTTLDVGEAWLIHPSFSVFSCSIDPGQHAFRDDGINVARATKASASRAAKATRFDPVGSEEAVVFASGPRMAAEWSLVLRTRRLVDRDVVVQICADQTPLLLRSPAGWVWDLPDGYYSVGDFDEPRPREGLHHADREITLPLTPTREPAVRVSPIWTYGMDLLRNPTYADSLAEFPTYLDRLTGP